MFLIYNVLSNVENVIRDAILIKYWNLHHKKGTKMLKSVQNAYLREVRKYCTNDDGTILFK